MIKLPKNSSINIQRKSLQKIAMQDLEVDSSSISGSISKSISLYTSNEKIHTIQSSQL